MSPRGVVDPEASKLVMISFQTTTRAIAAIVKHIFQIVFYTEADPRRLRLDPILITRLRE